LKNKGIVILVGLMAAVLVFAGIQFKDNQKMEQYLNKQLNERLGMLDLQVDTINFVTGNALEEKEISRVSLNEIQEALEMFRMKSLQVENLARGLSLDKESQLHGVTHNTARFMENRIQILMDEIGDKEKLSLHGDELSILHHIHDTSDEWKQESDTFIAVEKNIKRTDWVKTLIEMQSHSAEYQKVMDD
jgi:hypothetical protein